MSSRYRITTKLSQNTDSLFVMTIATERELVLDRTRLQVLTNAVRSVSDGPDSLSREDADYWLTVLDGLRVLSNRLGDRPPVERIGLQTLWHPLPTLLLDDILKKFSLNADTDLRVFVEGAVPDTSLVINIGAASAKFACPPSLVPAVKADLKRVQDAVDTAKQQGGTATDWNRAAVAVKDTGLLTTAVVECIAGLAMSEAWVGIGLALLSCGGAADAIKSMMDKAQDQTDRDRKEMDIERVHNSDGAALDGDKIDRFSRTA